jgi:serine/threonine-protein kinase SRPK3
VSSRNIAFTCRNAMDTEEDLIEAIGGEPEIAAYSSEEVSWSPELPKQLVRYATWPGWYETYDEDICLLDFGAAFPVDEAVTSIPQPRHLRSPETFFIGSFDYRHDLWRAGCEVGTFSYLVQVLIYGIPHEFFSVD